jgi:hypothetical protein
MVAVRNPPMTTRRAAAGMASRLAKLTIAIAHHRAADMMSIANQTIAELGGPLSVLSLQKRDHVKLGKLLDRMPGAPLPEQDAVLLDIYRLVFPHAFAEETVLWPVLRRVLPDGHELTLRVEIEHQQINELVTRLEGLESGSPDRQPMLIRLVELLSQDVADEETKLLPRLQANTTVAQQRLIGIAWEAARQIAPTRPHPIVSRRPPGNVFSALPLSIIDRLRDGVDARRFRQRAGARGLRTVSHALERVSRRVEEVPGMRSGEDPATRIGRRSKVGWGALAIITVAAGSSVLIYKRRRRPGAPKQNKAVELDMGQGSREQGFQMNGCR